MTDVISSNSSVKSNFTLDFVYRNRVLGPKRDRPVKRDGAEVEDGRGAAEHVGRQPHLADDAAEDPAADDRVDDAHGKDGQGHGQVSRGQRHDEEVGRDAQRRVLQH